MPTLQKGYTTLNIIKSYEPCSEGWETLLKGLDKNQADDEPLHILTLLKINGWDDTRWAFKCFNGIEKELRLFAADCAEAVLPIFESKFPMDKRPRLAIEAARKFANGKLDAAARTASHAAAADAYDAAAAAGATASRAAADAGATASRAASHAAAAAGAAASRAATRAATRAAYAAAAAAGTAASRTAAAAARAAAGATASRAAAAAASRAAAAGVSQAAQIENFKSYFNK